jgi:F-type H+-transporting ATPase subunit b
LKARIVGTLLAFAVCGFLATQAVSPRVALAWAAAPEQEETEKEAAHEKRELIYKIINFAILVGALGFVLRKPMAEFLSGRSESIRKALEEGRAALKESQAKLDAVEEKLKHLEEEIAAFRTSAEKEMQAERQRMTEETAREAEKILETARVRIETATRGAKLQLQAFTAQQALQLAEQMIRERLDEPSRQRLVSQFIETLASPEKRN